MVTGVRLQKQAFIGLAAIVVAGALAPSQAKDALAILWEALTLPF